MAPAWIYEVDPLALAKPVRFKIEASIRMNNRATTREMFQFMAPVLMNGQFLSMMAETGKTLDMDEFFRMAEDAAGTGDSYRLMRGFTPEEQQARSQPPPQLQAEMQRAKMEQDTRLQMGQMKSQTDLQVAQMEKETKEKEIAEESAREILSIMQHEKEAIMKGQQGKDPQALQIELAGKLQDVQLKAAQGRQKLELERAKAGMDLQKSALGAQQQAQQGAQEHAQSVSQSDQLHRQSLAQGQQKMQLEVLKQKMMAPSPGHRAQRGTKKSS